ncbi:response regulator transcription factor, partial [candidate division WWE3 bacterium]|nr:response regulator transcription factor [candidate division WWE3 bacterium]
MNMNMADEKLHILIIEDDYYVRELYERVLSNAGFDVFSAADGQEGYQLALRNPDLILLDIMLPGRNGLTVLRQLKDSD